jgi:hypothetical protein
VGRRFASLVAVAPAGALLILAASPSAASSCLTPGANPLTIPVSGAQIYLNTRAQAPTPFPSGTINSDTSTTAGSISSLVDSPASIATAATSLGSDPSVSASLTNTGADVLNSDALTTYSAVVCGPSSDYLNPVVITLTGTLTAVSPSPSVSTGRDARAAAILDISDTNYNLIYQAITPRDPTGDPITGTTTLINQAVTVFVDDPFLIQLNAQGEVDNLGATASASVDPVIGLCVGISTGPCPGQDNSQYSLVFSDGVGAAPVPLPGTMPLLGLGLAGVGFLRRRNAS